jgi:hypothetical protein
MIFSCKKENGFYWNDKEVWQRCIWMISNFAYMFVCWVGVVSISLAAVEFIELHT